MNYTRFISELAAHRRPSPLRTLAKYLHDPPPSLINMSIGLPNHEMFPFIGATFKLRNDTTITLSADKMKLALQYSNTPGIPDFLSKLHELQAAVHKPPTMTNPKTPESSMKIVVTPGCQDGIVKTCQAILNPGDSLLLEEPSYPGVLAFFHSQKYNLIGLKGDKDGLIPDSLQKVMSKWTPEQCHSTASKDIPRVIYLIPTGGNPTGTTISIRRKKEIYEIAQLYNLMIIEDDPYYYLNFEEVLYPSFLSMDVDGRVIRMDSFSKVLSSGIRIGFVTGPDIILEKIILHNQASLIHVSGVGQMMLNEIFNEWGINRFLDHTKDVRKFYEERRDMAMKYASKWLAGLAEWNCPAGGMFLWLTIPELKETANFVLKLAEEEQLIIVPGNVFMLDRLKPSNNLRISYSYSTEEQFDLGFKKLASAIRSEIKS